MLINDYVKKRGFCTMYVSFITDAQKIKTLSLQAILKMF